MSSPNEIPVGNGPADPAVPLDAPRRSLRTELLIGQLAVLAIVVLGFGGAMYALVRQGVYREAESDLLGAAQSIAQDLGHGDPRDDLRFARPHGHRFGPGPRDFAYFAIWDPEGHQIAGSNPLPPHVAPLERAPPLHGPRPFVVLANGPDIELIIAGPRNEQILVGRPLGRERDRLWRVFVWLCTVGALALGVGGLAAWWLASRVVRPLETLTQTAEQISARRLDQRLQLEPTTAELTRLASVFNGMLNRLQTAFQQQVRFTADASHELRTPVAVILTQAEHTLSRSRSEEEYRGALETCVRAARRMKRLVDDLLLLARADVGRLEIKAEACDLADVTRAALAWLEPLAAERQVRLSSQLHATHVLCDSAQITQVITNLVSNAIEYNRAGGEVFVTVQVQKNRAVLRVTDSGIGISPADQRRIFERFFRADPARSHRDGAGAGLGLSIVAEIIASHGGTIDVISTAEQGTTFTVDLPLAQSDSPETNSTSADL